MTSPEPEPEFNVVVNDEGQYSVWPRPLPVPAGWYLDGTSGPRQSCLDYIDKAWTDMRPRSLREHMSQVNGSLPAGALGERSPLPPC